MNFSAQLKIRLLFYLCISALLLGGCSVWENFTTYFNLYYNVTELFEKAENQIKLQKKDLFSIETPNVTGTANADLIKVIEKCSDLLQFNSESAYVDDALMMLGKSFYYQKNYQKSLRKFNELQVNYPESDLLLDALLWAGKCEMRLKNYDEGLTTLSSVRNAAIEAGEDAIIRESYIEEIVYKIRVEDYTSAIETANEFMNVSDDDEIKAQVWYETGKLNMKIGEIENAITAFHKVFEYSPDFDLQFNASLDYGKALREGNRSEEALAVFDDMRGEDKYTEDFVDIDFEIAKTNRTLGNIEEALNLFTKVDTMYRNTTTSGTAKYEIAQIYEYEYLNLDSAASYYKKSVASALPNEYMQPAREKNRLFSRYVTVSGDVSKYRKQLFYSENPEEFVSDSIAYVEDSLAIKDKIAELKDLQEIWARLDSLLNVQDTTGFYADTIRAIDSLIVSDTTLVKDTVLAKLKKPQPYDSIIVFRFDSLFQSENFQRTRTVKNNKFNEKLNRQNQLTDQLPDTLKFKNNPPQRPFISVDSLRTVLAKNELELGNLFLTEINMPDSARWYYYNILNGYPNTIYQANTIYALGSYYLTIDNKQRADSLFDVIYENYRNESIVNAAADKLNKPLIDLKYDPAKDDYENAEYILNRENYSEAVIQFYEIYKTYLGSLYAPKALYACGWILENILANPDSAAVMYDTLVTMYPTSDYVKQVAGKLSFYKQEQKRIQHALQDSLNLLNHVSIDSLTSDSLLHKLDADLPTDLSDSTQEALKDLEEKEKSPDEKKKDDQKLTIIPEDKEPLWNPRKRK